MPRRTGPAEHVEDFLGSAQMFALALNRIMEARLLQHAAGLTLPQVKILTLVSQAGTQTVGDVAALLNISDAAASKSVDRLVQRKLVKRTERPADRRAIELALTAEGQRVLASYDSARESLLTEVFGSFSTSELRDAAALLDRVTTSLVTSSPNPEAVCLQCGVHSRRQCLLEETMRRPCQYKKRFAPKGPLEAQK